MKHHPRSAWALKGICKQAGYTPLTATCCGRCGRRDASKRAICDCGLMGDRGEALRIALPRHDRVGLVVKDRDLRIQPDYS